MERDASAILLPLRNHQITPRTAIQIRSQKTLDKAPYTTFPEKKAIQKQPNSAPSGKSNQYDSLLSNLRAVLVNIQGLLSSCKMLFGEATGSLLKIDEIRDFLAKSEAPHILC